MTLVALLSCLDDFESFLITLGDICQLFWKHNVPGLDDSPIRDIKNQVRLLGSFTAIRQQTFIQ